MLIIVVDILAYIVGLLCFQPHLLRLGPLVGAFGGVGTRGTLGTSGTIGTFPSTIIGDSVVPTAGAAGI